MSGSEWVWSVTAYIAVGLAFHCSSIPILQAMNIEKLTIMGFTLLARFKCSQEILELLYKATYPRSEAATHGRLSRQLRLLFASRFYSFEGRQQRKAAWASSLCAAIEAITSGYVIESLPRKSPHGAPLIVSKNRLELTHGWGSLHPCVAAENYCEASYPLS